MRRFFLTCSVLLPLVCSTFGCGTADPPVRRYHVRGLVKEVGGTGADLSIAIHHEVIPGFEDRDGKRSPMPSMVMAFGVAPDVPRDLWSQGAKVAIDFEVRWGRQPTLYIRRAEALGGDVLLSLSQGH